MLLLDHTTPSDFPTDHPSPPAPASNAAASMASRYRIWELPDLQCAIVGTCLTLQECRRLARRAKISLPDDASDYVIHSALVRLCRTEGRTAQLVQKHLDRKYLRHIRQALKTNSEKQRRVLWREAAAAGDIPGPFWSLVTHPGLGQELFSEVFGQVHMLSHLMGASNRADVRKLQRYEAKVAESEASIATLKRAYRARIRDLSKRNRELAAREKGVKSGGNSIAFQQMFESLQLAHEERTQAEHRCEALEAKVSRLEALLVEQQVESRVLEGEVARLLELRRDQRCPKEAEDGMCEEHAACPHRTLAGKCILYVGGRSGMASLYREMVEGLGGSFVHHDGGREHALSRLHQMLPGADAVLCPMDCVSHEAFHCVKNACRQSLKPCLAMRSASLSSLSKTLEVLLEPSAIQPQGVSQ